jgi:hypothetical protein
MSTVLPARLTLSETGLDHRDATWRDISGVRGVLSVSPADDTTQLHVVLDTDSEDDAYPILRTLSEVAGVAEASLA